MSGGPGRLRVGAGCVIREYVTINVGSDKGDGVTDIGENCYFMTGAQIGHDCKIGCNVVMVNYSGLAGHCLIEDFIIIRETARSINSCASAVPLISGTDRCGERHHSVRDGDWQPRAAEGAQHRRPQRRGIENARSHVLRAAYRGLFAEKDTLRTRLDSVSAEYGHEPLARTVTDFIRASGKRGICVPKKVVASWSARADA